jgi:RNA polymerase sigma-70 factor (ECF subfamily)
MRKRRNGRKEFEAVALPHLDVLYGAACRLTRNPRDAEDLVQDAMLRAFRFWDTFEKDSNCKAWLFKILTNTFINKYQKAKRRREVHSAAAAEQEATDGVLVHKTAMASRDPQTMLIERTISDQVIDALQALPGDFRVAVVLCDLEGLSYKEIAEAMDCPIGTVMSRLYRGRRLLKKALRSYAIEEGIIRDSAGDADSAEMIKLSDYRNSENAN